MTRAKNRLELLSYGQDEGKPKEDSRFLNEVRGLLLKPGEAKKEQKPVKITKASIALNPDGIQDSDELVVGTAVKHRVFGNGEIIRRDGDEIHIQFGKMEKRLDLETVFRLGYLKRLAYEEAFMDWFGRSGRGNHTGGNWTGSFRMNRDFPFRRLP